MRVQMPLPALTPFVIVFLSNVIPVTFVYESRTRWIMQLLVPDLTKPGSIARACSPGFRLEAKRFFTFLLFLRFSGFLPALCCCKAPLACCLATEVKGSGGLWSVLSLGAP